jgi:hypothetical protein
VYNPSAAYGLSNTITKIEFINGSNKADPVLETKTVNFRRGEMSPVYTVSGFTGKSGDGHLFYVRLTFDDGVILSIWSSRPNKSKPDSTGKILVTTGYYSKDLSISEGDW